MPITLIVQNGKHKGTKLVLSKPKVTIGRDESCNLRLASAGISRQHCQLAAKDGQYLVSDIGSQNGTIVNGETIDGAVALKKGDIIVIGPMEFAVDQISSPDAEPSSDSGSGSKKAKPSKPGAKKAKVGVPKAKKGEPKASDDDIVDWLSSGMDDDAGSADSTIIMRAYRADAATPDDPTGDLTVEKLYEKSGKKVFNSLAEEAADIIQRHLESVGGVHPDEQ